MANHTVDHRGMRRGDTTSPRPGQQRRAFTLVELLVVIAIISLLVAILVPMLEQARDIARTAVCATNLASVGKGLHLYAADHDDWYPPFGSEVNRLLYPHSPPETKALNLRGKNLYGPIWAAVGRVWGYGRYVETPSLFFCPADDDADMCLEAGGQSFKYHEQDGCIGEMYSSYYWNTWAKKYPQRDLNNSQWDYAYRRLSEMPDDKPLGMDPAGELVGMLAHPMGKGGGLLFNVMHVDASVNPLELPPAYKQFMWGGGSGTNPLPRASLGYRWEKAGPYNDWVDLWAMLNDPSLIPQ